MQTAPQSAGMAEVETSTLSTAVDASSHPFSKEELERILEFDRIVKFRDQITSGKHPRIKVPSNLLPAASSSSTRSNSNAAVHPMTSEQQAQTGSPKNKHMALEDGQIQQEDSRSAPGTTALPGLGSVPSGAPVLTGQVHDVAGKEEASAEEKEKEVRANPALLARPGKLPFAEIEHERTKLEKALLAQVGQRANSVKALQARDALPDFAVEEVLQKARVLEKSFTPPPQPVAKNDTTNPASAASLAAARAAVAPDGNDSVDDATFYSSNFSTPEFALKSRVSIGPEGDHVSMEEGSDYEPELDIVPSPIVPQEDPADDSYDPAESYPELAIQPPALHHGHPPVQTWAGHPSAAATGSAPVSVPTPIEAIHSLSYPYQTSPASLLQAVVAQQLSNQSGPYGQIPSRTGSGQVSSDESSLQQRPADDAPRPPSPFVRVHGLSPVGPQPLTLAPQITPVLQEQAEAQGAALAAQRTRGTPAQVAMLRRTGASNNSSPDSSPQTGGGGRPADKKKGKKKNNKRKADQRAQSPRVKPEPKSPSPIVAPPPRPHKRSKQAPQTREEQDMRYADYSPATQEYERYAGERGVRYVQQGPPIREERASVVYERGRYTRPGTAASHPIEVHHEPYPRRDWEAYQGRPDAGVPSYAPQNSPQPVGQQPIRYALPPSRADMRPVRAASHALVEVSSGYPPPAPRSGYVPNSAYEARPMSVRPESSTRNRSRSPVVMPPRTPAMPPPSTGPQYRYPDELPPAQQPQTRLVVDEFGREYYEPLRPRQATVRYEPEEASQQEWRAPPPPTYARAQPPLRAVSQMPPPTFEEDGVVYRRASPPLVQPRRVVTQPDYGAPPPPPPPEYDQYRQREYMPRPGPPEDDYVRVRQAPPPNAPPPREYMVRASTAVPPDAVRYEVPPPSGRYQFERVGSVRPPDPALAGRDYPPPANPQIYGSRARDMPVAEAYGGGGGGREYSVRPEAQQPPVQRAYSVQHSMGPYPPPGPPGPKQFYAGRVPAGPRPEPEYAPYPEDGRHDVYR